MHIEKRKKLSFLKRIFLIELFKGLMVTLKNQFRPHTTVEYPKERLVLKERFRGVPRLRMHPETAEELCVACGNCAEACPDNCITVVAETRASGKGKQPKIFIIDYERCCLCGLCVDPCPTKPISAIYMSHDYELASYTREKFITEKDRLYSGHEKREYKK
ncbi:MAG: NADH-quinone oxidoreductase subunit I [Acidobacteriota bacterium]